jgi:hypothetical protein
VRGGGGRRLLARDLANRDARSIGRAEATVKEPSARDFNLCPQRQVPLSPC